MPTKKKTTRKAKPKSAKEVAPRPVRRSSAELHFTETTIIRGEAVDPLARRCRPARPTRSPVTTHPDSPSSNGKKRFSIC